MNDVTYSAYHHPELDTVVLLPTNKEKSHNCIQYLFSRFIYHLNNYVKTYQQMLPQKDLYNNLQPNYNGVCSPQSNYLSSKSKRSVTSHKKPKCF